MEKQNKPYTYAVGRRKASVARVRLNPGNGQITVNGKPIHEYFSGTIAQKTYQRPFEISQTQSKYSTSVVINGGGISSQLDAMVHGLSRAIALADSTKRTVLKRAGFLTRDARVKESRKYGNAQKARAKKQSPKR